MGKQVWLDSIIEALNNLGGGGHLSEIYEETRKIRLANSIPLTKEWKATVRKTLESYSSDSLNFKGEDTFAHPSNYNDGYWKLKAVSDKIADYAIHHRKPIQSECSIKIAAELLAIIEKIPNGEKRMNDVLLDWLSEIGEI